MSFVKQSEPPQSCGACKGPSPLVPYKYKQCEAIRRSYQSGAFINQWTKAAARATDTKQPDEQVVAQFTFAIQEHTHAHIRTPLPREPAPGSHTLTHTHALPYRKSLRQEHRHSHTYSLTDDHTRDSGKRLGPPRARSETVFQTRKHELETTFLRMQLSPLSLPPPLSSFLTLNDEGY